MKSLVLALLCFLPSLALAEDAQNVSKIDGQLVKVGDKNEYEYSYKKWNVGLNAFVLPLGYISMSGSYAVYENVAVRLGAAFDTNSSHHRTYSLYEKSSFSIGAPIYFKKVYNGFFLEPGVGSHSGLYAAGGYHWMWDSGFNIYLGVGFGSRDGGAGMLQVAYAFD